VRRVRAALGLALALGAAADASAQRAVYRSVDADGRVTYSERPGADGEQIQQWTPVSPNAYDYDGAVLRAERDRLYYERQRNEEAQPRTILIYDPRGSTARPSAAQPSTRWYDPNLPPSQPPTLERRYYYDGR
jgi:hypothetical protein